MWDFDVFGILEMNMYWPRVKPSLQFIDRVYSWFNPMDTRALCAFNKHEVRLKCSIRQYGGTGQIARGNAGLRHVDKGDDPTGLGRWVWQKILGKDQKLLWVITAYRPVKTYQAKVYTVYRQQWAHLKTEGFDPDPRVVLLQDLSAAIQTWRDQGDHVVLMMDVNEDIRSAPIHTFLDDLGMRKVILERHGKSTAPNTHLRGSDPIDGIFVTSSLEIVNGGYAAFDQGVTTKRSDHRCLWIDIQLVDVFGHTMPGPVKRAGRRVQCQDPRTTAAFCLKNRLSQRIFQLEARVVYPLPIELQAEAEGIAKLRYEGIRYADKRCWKLRFGGAAFKPEFVELEANLKTHDLLLAKRQQRRINSALIR
jgi:hypothetical protein